MPCIKNRLNQKPCFKRTMKATLNYVYELKHVACICHCTHLKSEDVIAHPWRDFNRCWKIIFTNTGRWAIILNWNLWDAISAHYAHLWKWCFVRSWFGPKNWRYGHWESLTHLNLVSIPLRCSHSIQPPDIKEGSIFGHRDSRLWWIYWWRLIDYLYKCQSSLLHQVSKYMSYRV